MKDSYEEKRFEKRLLKTTLPTGVRSHSCGRKEKLTATQTASAESSLHWLRNRFDASQLGNKNMLRASDYSVRTRTCATYNRLNLSSSNEQTTRETMFTQHALYICFSLIF